MSATQRYHVDVNPRKFKELIELTEEPRIGKIIDNAVAILHLAFVYATKGYKLGMIPVDGKGQQDPTRGVVMMDILHLQ